jgi:ribosomal subunit interface protein
MQSPLRITYRGLPSSEALEARIRSKVAKLEELHSSITSCHVTVEEEARHQSQGRLFKVRIDLHVPGHEFAVNRDHDEDVYVALRDAFDAAKRALEDDVRPRRGAMKEQETPGEGDSG